MYSECTATVQRDYRFDEALHQFAWSLAGPSNDQVQPSIDSVPQSHSVPLYLSRPAQLYSRSLQSSTHSAKERWQVNFLVVFLSPVSQSKYRTSQHIQTRIVYSNFSVLWLPVRWCPASVYLWELRGDSEQFFLDMIIALFGNLKKCQILRSILLAWKRFPENKQTPQVNLCNCCLVLKNLKFGRSSF